MKYEIQLNHRKKEKGILIIDHIAISADSEEESDRFFISLLGLKKDKVFTVDKDLNEKFFGIKKEQQIVRYSNKEVNLEVFITRKKSSVRDKFAHICFIIQDREQFLNKARRMGYDIIKVARKESNNYYLFIKDSFGNLFEIKSP